MAKSILEFVKNSEVLDFARRLNPEVFFGLQLFKPRMVDELNYTYIKGAGGTKTSIMAEVVAWESSAPLAPHEGLSTVEGELPPIKQKSRFSELEIQKIFNPRSTRERNNVIKTLYNDVQARVDGIFSRLNWIICQSLGKGSVTFVSENLKLPVDWGVPATQIMDTGDFGDLWSDHTNATPIADIQTMVDVLRTAGQSVPNSALTSSTIAAHVLQSVKVREAMFGSGETSRVLTLDALNQFLTSISLPKIFSYDEMVKVLQPDRTTVTERFFPEDSFTLFNDQDTLGNTLFGPTAESIRGIGVEEAPGVFAEVYETKDPVNVWTYATAVAFPTFPGADQIAIMHPIAA